MTLIAMAVGGVVGFLAPFAWMLTSSRPDNPQIGLAMIFFGMVGGFAGALFGLIREFVKSTAGTAERKSAGRGLLILLVIPVVLYVLFSGRVLHRFFD